MEWIFGTVVWLLSVAGAWVVGNRMGYRRGADLAVAASRAQLGSMIKDGTLRLGRSTMDEMVRNFKGGN